MCENPVKNWWRSRSCSNPHCVSSGIPCHTPQPPCSNTCRTESDDPLEQLLPPFLGCTKISTALLSGAKKKPFLTIDKHSVPRSHYTFLQPPGYDWRLEIEVWLSSKAQILLWWKGLGRALCSTGVSMFLWPKNQALNWLKDIVVMPHTAFVLCYSGESNILLHCLNSYQCLLDCGPNGSQSHWGQIPVFWPGTL